MADNNQFNPQAGINPSSTPNFDTNYNPNFGSQPVVNQYNPSLSDFNPQQSFDTTINQYPPVNNFNQNPTQINPSTPVDYTPYTSENSGFNNQSNDYNYSANNQPLEEFEEEVVENPKSNTKKILIFGLIGLAVILLVASVALYVINSNNKPVTSNLQNKPLISTTSSSETKSDTTKSSSVSKSSTKSGIIKTTPDLSTPAGKAIVNTGATKLPKTWIQDNFKTVAGAITTDGSCKILNICSEKSDPDNDGLTNLEEYIFATNPNQADTDSDGLSDGDEVHIYFSNPKSKDSDSDTFADGSEVANCYDPNAATTTKMDTFRLSEISSQANSTPLHQESKDILTKSGATTDDLEKGYISKNCGIPAGSNITTKTSENSSTAVPPPVTD
jgi:Bacterial TSP3 repeat